LLLLRRERHNAFPVSVLCAQRQNLLHGPLHEEELFIVLEPTNKQKKIKSELPIKYSDRGINGEKKITRTVNIVSHLDCKNPSKPNKKRVIHGKVGIVEANLVIDTTIE